MQTPDIDPKGLIRESYRIDGIRPEECRAIFLDWALSLPVGADMRAIIPLVLERHAAAQPDHPMNTVLRDGLASAPPPGRRGGRRARVP